MTKNDKPQVDKKLRQAIEQEVNAIRAGVNRDDMPENMGILIPSLDLQRAIDRIMELFATHTQQVREELIGKIPKKRKELSGNPTDMENYALSVELAINNGYNQAISDILTALNKEEL